MSRFRTYRKVSMNFLVGHQHPLCRRHERGRARRFDQGIDIGDLAGCNSQDHVVILPEVLEEGIQIVEILDAIKAEVWERLREITRERSGNLAGVISNH